jgi:hypothetical protein
LVSRLVYRKDWIFTNPGRQGISGTVQKGEPEMINQKAIRWLYAGYTFEQERDWKKKREEMKRGNNNSQW